MYENSVVSVHWVLEILVFGLTAFVLSLAGTYGILGWLRRHAVLDYPNARSSHTAPIPRGGGVVVSALVLIGWTYALVRNPPAIPVAVWGVLPSAFVLYVVSWIDDRRGLRRRIRFPVHLAAVSVVVFMLPDTYTLFGGWVPLWLDRLVSLLGWVWFLNLYNFMDGIDGLAAMQTSYIGVSLVVISALVSLPGVLPWDSLGAILAGSALGFLVFNWHPARLFLGDVGSIPLGFLIGFLLLILAMQGYLAVALIIPGYYVADATITLVRRAMKGCSFTVAHREHFYQKAVHQGARPHNQVVFSILKGNIALACAALLSVTVGALWGASVAVVLITILLVQLSRLQKGA